MRYESRHRPLKAAAQAISSSKDLLHSVAVKQILKFCKVIHNLKLKKKDDLVLGPCDSTDSFKYVEKNGVLY